MSNNQLYHRDKHPISKCELGTITLLGTTTPYDYNSVICVIVMYFDYMYGIYHSRRGWDTLLNVGGTISNSTIFLIFYSLPFLLNDFLFHSGGSNSTFPCQSPG